MSTAKTEFVEHGSCKDQKILAALLKKGDELHRQRSAMRGFQGLPFGGFATHASTMVWGHNYTMTVPIRPHLSSGVFVGVASDTIPAGAMITYDMTGLLRTMTT